MRSLKQVPALLYMNLAGLTQRVGPLLVTCIGTACVVGVLISLLSVGASARRQLLQATRADRVVITAGGNQGGAALTRTTLLAIVDAPGIKHGPDGKAIVAGMAFAVNEGRKQLDGSRVMYAIYGVEPQFLTLMPEIHLIAGRRFEPGVHELMVGKTRYAATEGLAIGDRVRLRGADWTVVGHFEASGSMGDAVLADANTLMVAFQIRAFTNIAAMLNTPADFERLKQTLKANPTVNVDIKHEAEYVADIGKQITKLIDFISYFIGTVMAIGATVGAVNAMYMIVDQRRRDTATLRALGFDSFALIIAILLESILIALPGAVLGAALAWVLFNGHHVSPVGISIDLVVTPDVVAIGILWALCMGLLGGLLPAVRAARESVAVALRAT